MEFHEEMKAAVYVGAYQVPRWPRLSRVVGIPCEAGNVERGILVIDPPDWSATLTTTTMLIVLLGTPPQLGLEPRFQSHRLSVAHPPIPPRVHTECRPIFKFGLCGFCGTLIFFAFQIWVRDEGG